MGDPDSILSRVGRTLRTIGLVILAAAAWLLVAGEAEWIARGLSDRWFLPLAGLGAACFAAGALLGILVPALRWVGRGRCVRCGAGTERGQVFCLDHLKESVHEAQEAARRNSFRKAR